ncbi:MAG: phosphoribosylformylglycinamidine (FGAM) synthase-like enzyme, partial [Verrucomicrobiales bacterium]
DVPYQGNSQSAVAKLFNEAPSRFLIEVRQSNVEALQAQFKGCPFAVIGKTDGQLRHLKIMRGDNTLIDEDLSELKDLWKHGLTPYY